MERFLSTISGRLDGKGRLSVPAPFRAVLEADGYPGLFVHQALDMSALDCGGRRLLAGIDALIDRYPPYSEERDLMATALLGGSETVKLDPEGRILLSERFKTYAGITGDVIFVGLGEKFRLFEPTRFQAHLDEAKSKVRMVRAQLSGGNRAGTTSGERET